VHPLLGAALMAVLAQFASGEEVPFTAPEGLGPGVNYCDDMWHALTGDCNPCITVGGALHRILGLDPFVCPE
jgi:hypothetical protein